MNMEKFYVTRDKDGELFLWLSDKPPEYDYDAWISDEDALFCNLIGLEDSYFGKQFDFLKSGEMFTLGEVRIDPNSVYGPKSTKSTNDNGEICW